jgi:TP901 family phage tail tape measure protein
MALELGSLFYLIGAEDKLTPALDKAESKAQGFSDRLGAIGGGMTSLGGGLTSIFAPMAAAFGVAANAGMQFDEAVTNTGAVLNLTSGEVSALKSELLTMGMNTRAGPQAIAEAYYDIAGGVTDASARMAIMQAAISTSQAGNAGLGGTTKALIAVMNSYKLGASGAANASDILTRTVGMGVGSMDEFATALPQVTGLANSLNISFEDLGGMTAYLTTQGNSASTATTQLAAMMTSALNPNETMKTALAELGFTSGQAAIEQLGLIGTFQALAGTQTANSEGMAKMSGSVEALRGITAMAGPDVAGFLGTFKSGVEGATAAAEAIQMGSPAAQFDLLKSSISGLAINVGTALLPALNQLMSAVTPIISSIVEWVQANPELVQQIATVALVGAGLGIGFVAVGSVISGVSAVVGVLTGALGFLLSPAGLMIVAIAGIVYALDKLYPGGLGKLLTDAATAAQQLSFIFMFVLSTAINWVRDNVIVPIITKVQELIATLQLAWDWIQKVGNNVGTAVQGGAGIVGGLTSGQWDLGQIWAATRSEFGFAEGGYTGSGNSGEVAGVVHRNEWVVPEGGALVMRGGDSGMTIQNLTIYANGQAEGRAAADGFVERMRERYNGRGN